MGKKNSIMTKDLWRVIMQPFGPASSNVYLGFNMIFFMVFCTEGLGLNPVTVGVVMTVARMIDGVIDPIIGNIIDRTETRFGKFRPFLLGGTTIMITAIIMMYQVSYAIPQDIRLVWVLIWDTIFVVGYSCVTTVNKATLSIVTKNPKQRPISGIAGGLNTTLLKAITASGIAIAIQNAGGFQSPEAWRIGSFLAIALNVFVLILGLIPIWTRDTPEFYDRSEEDNNAPKEKPKLREIIEVIKINKPLRMLMVVASQNKLADSIASAAMMYFYMYSVQNIDLQPIVSAATAPVGLIGSVIVGLIAAKIGSRNAFLVGTFGSIVIQAIFVVFRPFDASLATVFVVLMVANELSMRFNAQNVDPMIADVIDYHQYKTGKYIPGIIASTFSFIEQFISSFGSSITGLIMGFAGYRAGVEPTTALYWAALLLYFGIPLAGDIISVFALKKYEITNNMYKKMYKDGELVIESDAQTETSTTTV